MSHTNQREYSREYNSDSSDEIFDPNAPSEHGDGDGDASSQNESDETESVPESEFVDHNIEAADLPEGFEQMAIDNDLNKNDFMQSVVKISCTSQDFDYKQPWQSANIQDCGGTGFIIDGQRIITNAHVIEGHRYIKVEMGQSGEQYTAEVELIGNDCDLAILNVKEPEFWENSKPLNIGRMTGIEKRVKVLGFPVGGDEMSTTKGIVSRIQVDTYEQAEQNLLSVQVDAAINPGNSGGPVVAKNPLGQYEVVGVAFQGLDGVQNCGYMIPPPVLNHFLEEANHLLENPEKEYIGFPALNIVYQEMKSKALRKSLGMHDDESGVRIQEIDHLSTAKNKLKVNDVILEIDGHKVKNDGMINYFFRDLNKELRLHYSFLFHQKFAGENIDLVILRDKKTLEIEVELQSAIETNMCQWEFDQQPNFFIESGIAFQTISLNFLTNPESVEFVGSSGNTSFEEMAKKHPDDQKIFINKVLRCDATIGYEDENHAIIKSVNGKTINNMHDLIDAFKTNKGEFHSILTTKEAQIVVKRMSQKEHQKLLDHYSILLDKSDCYKKYCDKKYPQLEKDSSSDSDSNRKKGKDRGKDESKRKDKALSAAGAADKYRDRDRDRGYAGKGKGRYQQIPGQESSESDSESESEAENLAQVIAASRSHSKYKDRGRDRDGGSSRDIHRSSSSLDSSKDSGRDSGSSRNSKSSSSKSSRSRHEQQEEYSRKLASENTLSRMLASAHEKREAEKDSRKDESQEHISESSSPKSRTKSSHKSKGPKKQKEVEAEQQAAASSESEQEMQSEADTESGYDSDEDFEPKKYSLRPKGNDDLGKPEAEVSEINPAAVSIMSRKRDRVSANRNDNRSNNRDNNREDQDNSGDAVTSFYQTRSKRRLTRSDDKNKRRTPDVA
jgi:S1-C subfamily serine protease